MIDGLPTLEAFGGSLRPLVLQRHGAVELRLSCLAPAETERWTRRINRQYGACGCETGAIGMAATAGAYLLLVALSEPGLAALGWREAGIGLAAACGGALTGKLLGLLHAYRKLKNSLHDLSDVVRTRSGSPESATKGDRDGM